MDTSNFKEVFTSDEVKHLRQRVAELERFHELDTKQIAYLFEERNNLTAERDELLAAKGKVSVTLTGKEIREIAELAGLQFVEHDYTDEYETEIAIESCPDKGIMNDDNAPEHYRLIAFLNEYPEEGCIGLGEKIEASAIARVKGGSA